MSTSKTYNKYHDSNYSVNRNRKREKSIDELTEKEVRQALDAVKKEYEEKKANRGKKLREEVQDWLNRVSYMEFRNSICQKVRGQEGVEYILFNAYCYFRAIANGQKHRSHVLVAAPSGCGKSATYQALREYFAKEIPGLVVWRKDMSNITEGGFKGEDPITILNPLFKKNDEQNGEGIIFLDEFDKKLVSSTNSVGENINMAIQGQLLTMLEGCEVCEEKNPSSTVNTENTLFIAMGAFDRIRKQRKNAFQDQKKTIGFRCGSTNEYNHFEEITSEDILKMGASYELIGRFPMIVNFHPLTNEVISEIIDDECAEIATQLCTNLIIDNSFRQELIKEANGSFGCRTIYNQIYSLAVKGCHDIMIQGYNTENSVITLKEQGNYSIKKKIYISTNNRARNSGKKSAEKV